MIPSLSPTPQRRPPECPTNIRLLRGRPSNIRLIPSSTYTRATGRTTAQKTGLRYEEKVQRALLDYFKPPREYLAAPFIHYSDDRGYHTRVPDGIATIDGVKYILEIKLGHTEVSWWQLERVYRPLVEAYYHTFPVRVCEICRSFDPMVSFPSKFRRLESIDELPSLGKGEFGVLRWKP